MAWQREAGRTTGKRIGKESDSEELLDLCAIAGRGMFGAVAECSSQLRPHQRDAKPYWIALSETYQSGIIKQKD